MRFSDDEQDAMLDGVGETATCYGNEFMAVFNEAAEQVALTDGAVVATPAHAVIAWHVVDDCGLTGDQDEGSTIEFSGRSFRILSIDRDQGGFAVLRLGAVI